MALNATQREAKDFSNKRFQLILSINDKNSSFVDDAGNIVNDFVICQRYFDTFNFIEGSMLSLDFLRVINESVNAIEDELKMESQIWQTYNWTGSQPKSFKGADLQSNGGWYNDNDILDEDLLKPMDEPWTYTLKLSILDNEKRGDNKTVIERIFDATCYPKEIRENIDLTNDLKGTDTDRLNGVAYIKAIIKQNRANLVSVILNKIYSVCSPNTKDGKSGNDEKRIMRMLGETYLKYETGAKAKYIYDQDRRKRLQERKGEW